jgi:hypothetical protein
MVMNMAGRQTFQCLSSLVLLSDPRAQRDAHDVRHAVDHALSCDRLIRCGQRLECTWMAAELADWLTSR